jgi:hypothetical protein
MLACVKNYLEMFVNVGAYIHFETGPGCSATVHDGNVQCITAGGTLGLLQIAAIRYH